MLANLVTAATQPLLPAVETVRHYTFTKFRKDVLAGLTVSVVEVPQAMAYALIAGVPPQYGIYTSIIQGIIGALLSSSEHLTTGPTNTQSLLIASAAARVAGLSPTAYLQLVFGLTLIKGLIQLCCAAARLGDMVRYISRSVIVGVAAGSGVLIIVGQLPHFLGVTPSPMHHLPGVLGAIERLWPHVGEINRHSVAIGVASLIIVLGVQRISRFLPGAFLAIALAGGAVALAGWDSALPVIGPLPRGFPRLQMPQITWADAQALFGGALALAILGMLESVAIVKSIAAQTGETINPNQEFFAQGLKNFFSSFLQCIPGSGSFTRSALDYAAGAQTRFAAVFNSLLVAAIFWIFAGQAQHIPLASLAAVLFVIAYQLIDWRYITRTVRTSRPDLLVVVVTILATLLTPLEYAVFIGVFLNIGLYLRQASRLHLAEMVKTPGGPFMEVPLHDRGGSKQVMFLQIEGDLFFAVADELEQRLSALMRGPVRVVIFRLRRTHSIDATALFVLERFVRQMHSQRRHVILCGLNSDLMSVLKRDGLVELIGAENVFPRGSGVFASAKRAMERARKIVGSSIDVEGLDMEDEHAGAEYEI